ncbi:MAG: nitrogenase component 1 [Anaerovoracaceae bacterium]|jgi:nitrogenase molybdenum-iron protein alpha/beta subunit
MIDLKRSSEACCLPPSAAPDRRSCRIADADREMPFYIGLEYTPPARGTWTIAHTPMLIPGAHMIFVCPECCLRGVVLSAEEDGGLDRFSMVTVEEQDVIGDQMESLFVEGVTDVLHKLPALPPLVMIYTSCIHHFLAVDLDLIFSELERRFPGVDFVRAYMNCTMRKTRLNYEEVQWRQNYAALKPAEKDPKRVNFVGNYYALRRGSEPVRMLEDAGYTVGDLCRTRTYEEYQELAKASLNIYNWPVAKECARSLNARLGQEPFYLPYSWDGDEIEASLRALAEKTGAPMPDLASLREEAERALDEARKKTDGMEVRIDAVGTPRPLGLARLLLSHGFDVTTVYTDAILPGDEDAAAWLKEHDPDLTLCSMTHHRSRYMDRNEEGKRILAIGQRAAYFSGTENFVDLVANSGLIGYTGIRELAEQIGDAASAPKDTRRLIQIKAKGCRP